MPLPGLKAWSMFRAPEIGLHCLACYRHYGVNMRQRIIFAAVLVFFLVCGNAQAGLLKNQVLFDNGSARSYHLYVPDKTADKPMPLVLLLHGHMGDADFMTGQRRKKSPYKLWLDIAEREGWYLIIPNGEKGSDNFQGWNDCRADAKTNPTSDDLSFLNALVDAISRKYSIDKQRVYAHGTSNGGNIAYRLAQESGEKYRAIAAVVAAMPANNKCEHSKAPVSVLIMNGTEDPLMPYEGGYVGKRKSHQTARGSVLSTQSTLDYWLKNNDINSQPIIKKSADLNTHDKSQILVKQYVNQKNNTEVILYEMQGAGHTEPSLSEHYRRLYTLIVGRQNKDVEMAEEVWKFFERNQ